MSDTLATLQKQTLQTIQTKFAATVKVAPQGADSVPLDLSMPVTDVVVGWSGKEFSVFLRGVSGGAKIAVQLRMQCTPDLNARGELSIAARDESKMQPNAAALATTSDLAKFGLLAWTSKPEKPATLNDYINILLDKENRRDLYDYFGEKDVDNGSRYWCYRIIEDFDIHNVVEPNGETAVIDFFSEQAEKLQKGEIFKGKGYKLDVTTIPGEFADETFDEVVPPAL